VDKAITCWEIASHSSGIRSAGAVQLTKSLHLHQQTH
jgi:hypothetical protein